MFTNIYNYIINFIYKLFKKPNVDYSKIVLITETNYQYYNNVLPYIKSILHNNIKWITDVIYNKSTNQIILHRNDKFIIIKDIVWDDNNSNNFYVLAIPTKMIKNIRHISIHDINLLNNIKNKIYYIASQYNIPKEKLYLFFHYHPSYYQLHLHACVIGNKYLQNKFKRHYFLDDIIEKLNINKYYWENATLTYELSIDSELYKIISIS